MKKAIVLLSGGLDSTTVATLATKRDGYDCIALSFSYGQRHKAELYAAELVAKALDIRRHDFLRLPIWGGSALNSNIDVPKDRPVEGMADEIPVTYVPARNTIFLAFAAAYAEVTGAERIYAGMNALDYSGYPDCRPEFMAAWQEVIDLGTKAGIEGSGSKLITPLIELDKAEIIGLGLQWDAPFKYTHSCYDPVGPLALACGRCDSCVLRLDGFRRNGVTDPITYHPAVPV